ncbi:hypothetical protein TNCV_3320791 [Trichonephila clavipes]|nr:hypothetical protein TNCV_3320791 [Trichonephila clavipes]
MGKKAVNGLDQRSRKSSRMSLINGAKTVQKVALSYFSPGSPMWEDSNRAPSVPNASTLSITPKRSPSRDV